MIYVERTATEAPDVLRSKRAKTALVEAREYFSSERRERVQQRHKFDDELWLKVAPALKKLFHGKCAYCERRFERAEAIQVDHFRPTIHAKQLSGAPMPDHYWWLAYDYSNLYPTCSECRSHKGTTFPVGKSRASIGATGKALLTEGALLIDPCTEDPQQFLLFLPNGTVVPAGKGKQADRARATIEILALNRKRLVEGRSHAMEEVSAACYTLGRRKHRLVAGTGAAMSHPAARVRKLLASWLPFSAARRQAAHDALKDMGPYGIQIAALLPTLLPSNDSKEDKNRIATVSRKRRTAYVRELSIANVKGIKRLDLAFKEPESPPSAHPDAVGWRVFVGENGVGKSSVLQALALALAGQRTVQKMMINWEKILRRPKGSRARPKEGFVKVTLSTGDVIDLRFNSNGAWYESGSAGAMTTLRAYGATRNLPTTRAPASWSAVEGMVRVINLFDSYSPLCGAEHWLAALPKARFDAVALALKDLMQLSADQCIWRKRSRANYEDRLIPFVDMHGSDNRLDEISEGYQSMVAVAIDIMAGLSKKTADYQTEPGIVMIDELGNHLHPTWRMQVVSSLRRCFPRIQFIVTTHDPLCLRGLEVGEIAVLRREGNEVTAQIVEESIAHLRADQLLTSPLFGLVSTRDPQLVDASRGKERRYDELFTKATRTAAEESELQTLREGIIRRTAAGETPADRFVEEAVRKVLDELARTPPAVSPLQPKPNAKEIKAAATAKLARLVK